MANNESGGWRKSVQGFIAKHIPRFASYLTDDWTGGRIIGAPRLGSGSQAVVAGGARQSPAGAARQSPAGAAGQSPGSVQAVQVAGEGTLTREASVDAAVVAARGDELWLSAVPFHAMGPAVYREWVGVLLRRLIEAESTPDSVRAETGTENEAANIRAQIAATIAHFGEPEAASTVPSDGKSTPQLTAINAALQNPTLTATERFELLESLRKGSNDEERHVISIAQSTLSNSRLALQVAGMETGDEALVRRHLERDQTREQTSALQIANVTAGEKLQMLLDKHPLELAQITSKTAVNNATVQNLAALASYNWERANEVRALIPSKKALNDARAQLLEAQAGTSGAKAASIIEATRQSNQLFAGVKKLQGMAVSKAQMDLQEKQMAMIDRWATMVLDGTITAQQAQKLASDSWKLVKGAGVTREAFGSMMDTYQAAYDTNLVKIEKQDALKHSQALELSRAPAEAAGLTQWMNKYSDRIIVGGGPRYDQGIEAVRQAQMRRGQTPMAQRNLAAGAMPAAAWAPVVPGLRAGFDSALRPPPVTPPTLPAAQQSTNPAGLGNVRAA